VATKYYLIDIYYPRLDQCNKPSTLVRVITAIPARRIGWISTFSMALMGAGQKVFIVFWSADVYRGIGNLGKCFSRLLEYSRFHGYIPPSYLCVSNPCFWRQVLEDGAISNMTDETDDYVEVAIYPRDRIAHIIIERLGKIAHHVDCQNCNTYRTSRHRTSRYIKEGSPS